MKKKADLVLNRICYAGHGTFGEMSVSGKLILTVEQPWNNNAKGRSCIPDGTYLCKPRKYHAGGYNAIEITNVPKRTHILIHKANYPSELRGCIAPTMFAMGKVGAWGGAKSADAFRHIMRHFGGKEFVLKIQPAKRSAAWRTGGGI